MKKKVDDTVVGASRQDVVLRAHMQQIVNIMDRGTRQVVTAEFSPVSPDPELERADSEAPASRSRGSSRRQLDPASRSRGRETKPNLDGATDANPESLSALLRKLLCAQERVHSAMQRWGCLLQAYETDIKAQNLNPEEADKQNPIQRTWDRILKRFHQSGLEKLLLSLAAVCAAFMSAMILWSELCMASTVSLSPWGRLIAALASPEDSSGEARVADPATIQVIALVPFAYMSLCTYYSLFKLRLFGIFTLHPRNSSPGPLITNAIYLIRLQFPLGYNYLLMLFPPNASGQSAYSTSIAFRTLFGSSMSTVPLFGHGFVIYAPLVLALLCVFTLLNVYSRLLGFVGIDLEETSLAAVDEEDAAERLREGSMLLDQAYRRKLGVSSKNWKVEPKAGAHANASVGKSPAAEAFRREATPSPLFNEGFELSRIGDALE